MGWTLVIATFVFAVGLILYDHAWTMIIRREKSGGLSAYIATTVLLAGIVMLYLSAVLLPIWAAIQGS